MVQPIVEIGIIEREDNQIFFIRDNGVGFDMKYATPNGLDPNEEIMSRVLRIAEGSGSKIRGCNSPEEAVTGAGVVYTDVFVSMGEENIEGKMGSFDGFQVNEDLNNIH